MHERDIYGAGEYVMDKYELYRDIEERVIKVVKEEVGEEGEYMAIIGVVLQAMKDAMGLYRSDAYIVPKYIVPEYERRFQPPERYGLERRSWQEDAIMWFRNKEHWLFCDLCGVEPTWITWWLKNRAGVKLD